LVRRADAMIASGACGMPTFLKVDVEGAEGAFLEGCGSALPPTARVVVAVHSAAADRRCSDWFETHGFVQMSSPALRRSREGTWQSDPDLYAFGPAADPDGAARRELRRSGAIDN
ncbi:MAG: hypothetical protein ABMA00_12965, partial [Gemmatimonas sp.]